MKLDDGKKRNRNALRSKRLLVEAYEELMQIMPAEKITVTAVVDRAGLNRSTFYAHFTDVEDILEYIGSNIAHKLSEIMNELDCRRTLYDPLPMLMRVSEFIEERKSFYTKVVRLNPSGRLIYNLKEILIDYLAKDINTVRSFAAEGEFYINLRFIAGGYFSLCCDWLRGTINMPLKDISAAIAKTIQSGTAQYMKRGGDELHTAVSAFV